MRPPGYEPGELPTAPLRDIIFFVGAKVRLFNETGKFFSSFFVKGQCYRVNRAHRANWQVQNWSRVTQTKKRGKASMRSLKPPEKAFAPNL